jgi:hypothetical protein
MRSDEILRLKALQLKQLNSTGVSDGRIIDHLIDQEPEVQEKLRNICAFISPALFADVEGLCSLLDLSKREVVQMALVDLVKKAGKIVDQVNPFNEAQAQEEHA